MQFKMRPPIIQWRDGRRANFRHTYRSWCTYRYFSVDIDFTHISISIDRINFAAIFKSLYVEQPPWRQCLTSLRVFRVFRRSKVSLTHKWVSRLSRLAMCDRWNVSALVNVASLLIFGRCGRYSSCRVVSNTRKNLCHRLLVVDSNKFE